MSAELPPICDYEGSDYQASFWDSGNRTYEDGVEAIALKRLLPPGGKLLLEIGAGAGRNTPRYKNFERIVLLDYSRSQLVQAQKRLGRSERFVYVVANVYRLPFVPGLFDTATMIRTLHHLADAPLALRQTRQVLKSGAIFILEYANKQNLKAILRFLLRRQTWNPFNPEPVEFAELNFDFHPKAIRHWLNDAGFRLDKQLTVSHYRSALLKRLFPTAWLVTMDSLAQLTGNWWQLSPSVFTRSTASGDSPIASLGEFFRCPACTHFPLEETPNAMKCPACGKNWPVQDGIYQFRE
ncbi:MAG: class I SAM-dependent methyltransferase [Anaerolineales bacterium]|nr:class I SAM-dependent methyltransferase [Anaerolineales bacterium]